MRILLINPPFFDVYKGFKAAAKVGAVYPPSGLLYVASYLLEKGHQVELVDVDVEELDLEGVVERAKSFDPDFVGITSTTPTYSKAKEIIEELKRGMDVITVMGGIHITILMEEVLEDIPELDFGIHGEGEITFAEFLKCYECKGDYKEIKGLIFRDNDGKIQKNSSRDLAGDLDSLPFPARHLLKREKYLWSVQNRGVKEIALIFTKRGCPFRCKFCSAHSMFGYNVRYRSIQKVVDEVEEIVSGLGIDHLLYSDDTLIIKRERMVEFCTEVKKRNLKFTWEGMARVDLIDLEILEMMREVGLVRLSFGVESGDQQILDSESKGTTLEQIRKAYRWAKECGIETRGSVIIGHPGETYKSVLNTLKFLRNIKDLDQVYINIMVPYPGTEVYETAKRKRKGMRLLTEDYREFTRYNNSVIEVNDLTRKRLIFLQKVGLLYFYLTPRRIYYNIKRAGFRAGMRNVRAFVQSIFSRTN